MRKLFHKAMKLGRKFDSTKISKMGMDELLSWMKEVIHETLETYGYERRRHFFGGDGVYELEITEENIGCGGFVHTEMWTNQVKISVKDILDRVKNGFLLSIMFPSMITRGQVELITKVVCWHEYYHTTKENYWEIINHPEDWKLPHDARCWEKSADEYALRKLNEFLGIS